MTELNARSVSGYVEEEKDGLLVFQRVVTTVVVRILVSRIDRVR